MNNPLFNLNTQSMGSVASAATTPNALNKKRKFAGNIGSILNLANAPGMSNGIGDFGGKARIQSVAPNRVVTDQQPINAQQVQPQMQQQQVQQQPLQQNTQTNLPFGGVSQLQASPQAFMSFLRQFNRV